MQLSMLFLPCLLARLPPKKKRKRRRVSVSQAKDNSGGSIPLHLVDPPPRRRREEKEKTQTPESVCHAQRGTSHTNPCDPEQGRKTKAEDVFWNPSFYEEALNTP
jgi:hypothetical protein